jgi:hypothetical protein
MIWGMACWPSTGFAGPASPGRLRGWGGRLRPGRRQGVSRSGRRSAVAHRPRNRCTPDRQLRPNGPSLADPSSSLPFLLFVLPSDLGPDRTSVRTAYTTAVENATRRTDTQKPEHGGPSCVNRTRTGYGSLIRGMQEKWRQANTSKTQHRPPRTLWRRLLSFRHGCRLHWTRWPREVAMRYVQKTSHGQRNGACPSGRLPRKGLS